MSSVAALSIAAFILSLVATGVVRSQALKRKIFDLPNERSSHVSPTPRGGGLGIVLASFFSILVLWLKDMIDWRLAVCVLLGGGLMGLVGFLDDRRSQSALNRFAVHVSAACIAVGLLGSVRIAVTFGSIPLLVWIDFILTVIAVVWITNLFNFMDGIDGIAASESAFVVGSGALVTWKFSHDLGATESMAALAAASLGFLYWNWPPARIFMGDVGSGFLGFCIAIFGLYSSLHAGVPIAVWLILGGAFFVDATVTLLRRVYRGDQWLAAHRIHGYQHLARRFKSHRPVTLAVIALNFFWLLPFAWLVAAVPDHGLLITGVVYVPMILLAIAVGSGRGEHS